jgi:hypothetical protein
MRGVSDGGDGSDALATKIKEPLNTFTTCFNGHMNECSAISELDMGKF